MNIPAKETTDIRVRNLNKVNQIFDTRYIITHFKLATSGTTDNQIFYIDVLKRLIDAVKRGSEERFAEITHRLICTARNLHILCFEFRNF
jgi:hypothetical protein